MFLKFRSISFLDYFIHTTNLMCVTRHIIFFSPILPFIICRYHYFHSYQKNKKKLAANIKNAEHLFHGKHFLRSSAALQTIRMYVYFSYTYIHISVSCSKKVATGLLTYGGESFLVIVLIQEQNFFFLYYDISVSRNSYLIRWNSGKGAPSWHGVIVFIMEIKGCVSAVCLNCYGELCGRQSCQLGRYYYYYIQIP